MRIFYAVQATGNGHIARAMEVVPHLKKYGEVDIFLSGNNSSLQIDLPVKYRSNGVSLFYGKNGNLNYSKIISSFSPFSIWRDACELPVEKYDIVINDFESVSALACRIKKKPFVHFGHQASFVSSNTPRPHIKDKVGEWVLRNYASSPYSIGLHFHPYDDFIYSPIIKKEILETQPCNKGHVTIYLSQYDDTFLSKYLESLSEVEFHLFSKSAKQITRLKNITIFPVDKQLFDKSMIESFGIITGAGFETPSEAMYLKKKLLCIPISGHYEQLCNAVALKKMNVTVLEKINEVFPLDIQRWLGNGSQGKLTLHQTTEQIVDNVVRMGKVLFTNSDFASSSETDTSYHSEWIKKGQFTEVN
ncbi:MAG: hypothetical protein RIR96_476 [Bacteroidota bacterium]|jgi:uncharacterized protein (TIGR00661 family)